MTRAPSTSDESRHALKIEQRVDRLENDTRVSITKLDGKLDDQAKDIRGLSERLSRIEALLEEKKSAPWIATLIGVAASAVVTAVLTYVGWTTYTINKHQPTWQPFDSLSQP